MASGWDILIYHFFKFLFVGTAGDSFTYHNGMAFSAKDQDSDDYSSNCAAFWKGGWWFRTCHNAFLNGLYQHKPNTLLVNGVVWSKWKNSWYSFKRVEMKIKPANAWGTIFNIIFTINLNGVYWSVCKTKKAPSLVNETLNFALLTKMHQ